MPYKLRKARNQDKFFVIGTESGKPHSKEPLPKPVAEAQMRALYRSEGLMKKKSVKKPMKK